MPMNRGGYLKVVDIRLTKKKEKKKGNFELLNFICTVTAHYVCVGVYNWSWY